MAPARTNEKESGEPRPKKRPGRVPVSCAECRRLKLRCDRKVPCETCVKRGCAAICPEGSLTTGKGNRYALGDAEELHKKIERLRTRSAALEDALRTLQAAVSDEPHPLLREGSAQTSSAEASSSSPTHGPLLSREDEEVLDAFGTLTLGLRGETRFFGQTSRSEYLIHAPIRTQCNPPASLSFPRISCNLVAEANIELDVPCNHAAVQEEVRKLLPPLSRACELCEIFTEYGQYMWYPIPRKELFDDILGSVYNSNPTTPCDLAGTHNIALLFSIFALATLFDPNMPPYAAEAHEYYLVSRVCLRCAPPLVDTTLSAVQCLIYMTQYLEMSDCEPAHSGSHKAWIQIGLAAKLGHGIGLHVHGARWKLEDEAIQKRGRVFWQLFVHDTWISFGFGRPPSMSLAFIDCQFPAEPEDRLNLQGQKEWGFHSWTWRYTKLLHTIITTVFGASTPQYSTIIEYDRKVRDFPIPEYLRIQCGLGEPVPSAPLFLQRFLIMTCKEATLLSLHRAFFTHALREQPHDLLRHRYGPSVMAIYRSAWRVIEGTKAIFEKAPLIATRLGLTWSHSLAGGIVMCLLVTRAPSSSLAPSSLRELDILCELFEKAAGSCQIAANNLDVVRKLRRQGHETMNKSQPSDKMDVIDQELDRLGGKTHLMTSTAEPPISCTVTNEMLRNVANTSASSSTSMLPAAPTPPLIPSETIHPTIMQDLRVFDGAYGSPDFSQFSMDYPTDLRQPAFTNTPDIFSELFGTQQSMPVETEPALILTPTIGPPMLDATWQSFVEQLGF